MQGLFETLTHALEDAAGVALTAAFVWGILSVVLSPCHLASIPLIVGFIHGQPGLTTRRALLLSWLFAGGTLVSIGVIGGVTALAGRILGDIGAYGNYGVAFIFFLVGLHLLDVLPLAWSGPGQVAGRRGPLAAVALGLLFGFALGPCTFAFMAPLLGVIFKLGENQFWPALWLLGFFGLGHCAVIVLAGTSAKLVQKALDWNERSRGLTVSRKICGVLVLLGGLYLIYTAP